MANYQVIDAHGSIITIQSSTFGGVERQIVGVSIMGALTTTPAGNQSVSGVVGASVIGLPTVQTGNTSVITLIQGSVATVGTAVANQSVSGTVGASVIGTVPTTQAGLHYTSILIASVVGAIPVTGAFSGGTSSVIQQGDWRVSVISSTPSSMLVGASIIGSPPVSVTFPVNQNVSGSVVGFQGTDPWIITGSVQGAFSPSGNQSVSGTVGASIIGLPPVSQGTSPWIITGSVQAQVDTGNSSVQVLNFPVNQNVSGSVVAFQGTDPFIITGSVQGAFSPSGNQSVSGTVGASVIGTVPTTQDGLRYTSVLIASVVGAIPVTGAFGGGTSSVIQQGAWRVSVLSSTPSSMLVGASVIGLTPVTVTNIPQASIHGAVTFLAASVVSGHGSVNGAASVQILAAPGSGLYNYVTDFLLSNTGTATTLVTFTDGDGSVMGKSIAPTAGGAIATSLSSPMKTLQTNKVVNIVAATATSVLHAWIGGYKST